MSTQPDPASGPPRPMTAQRKARIDRQWDAEPRPGTPVFASSASIRPSPANSNLLFRIKNRLLRGRDLVSPPRLADHLVTEHDNSVCLKGEIERAVRLDKRCRHLRQRGTIPGHLQCRGRLPCHRQWPAVDDAIEVMGARASSRGNQACDWPASPGKPLPEPMQTALLENGNSQCD